MNNRTVLGGLRFVGICLAVLVAAGGRDAWAAKNPSLKCRAAVAKGVDGLVAAGLKALDACHKNRDKGKASGDCNELAANATVARALARARSKVDALCRSEDPVLQNFPNGTTDGVKSVLFPAVIAVLEASGQNIQGAPTFAGDKATVKRLSKCHGAVGKARTATVSEIVKSAGACQKRLDKGASEFNSIAPECITGPGKKSGKAVAKVPGTCSGIDGATIGSCDPIPDCIVSDATGEGQLLARLAFGGPVQCGNGLVELGEACDDGNTVDGDECPSTCQNAVCGDGVKAGAEQCDDGNNSNTDSCTNLCEPARCGDGFVQDGVEECDDAAPPEGVTCLACELAAATCGADGLVQTTVELEYPDTGPRPGVLQVKLDYPDFVQIPGSLDAPEVLAAITDLSGVGILVVNDDDATAAVTVGYFDFDTAGEPNLLAGSLYRAELQGCAQGTPIRPRDFTCTVVEAGDALGGALPDVTCRVLSLTAAGTPPPPTTSTTSTPTSSSSTSSAAGGTTSTTSTTILSALCGNGNIDQGETCDDGNTEHNDSCPSNCAVAACDQAANPGGMITVTLDNQQGTSFGVATVFVDYPEGRVFLPGSGEDAQVQAAVTGRPTTGSPTCVVFDRDHGVQFGCFSIPGFADGQLFQAAFNDCQSPTPPSASDFTCTVIEAANPQSVEVGATCTVTLS